MQKQNDGEWRHQDGDIGQSQLHSPSQEQLTTIRGQDTAEKILEHGGKAEANPCTTETKTDHTGRVRGAVAHQPHCLPPGQCSTVSRGLSWACGSSRGKDAQVGRPAPRCCGLHLGSLFLVSHHREGTGICSTRTSGNSIATRKSWRCNNQHSDRDRPSPYLQRPSRGPSQQLCSSAEPGRWHSLTGELSRMLVHLTEVLTWRALPALEPGPPPDPPRQGSWALPCLLLSEPPGPIQLESLARTSGNLCSPAMLKWKVWQTE